MENKTKHTPGPWTVKTIKDGFHDGKAFIFGPQLDKSEYRPAPVVLLVEKPCKDKDEHAANLALCAAAPDLLAALESCADLLADPCPTHKRAERLLVSVRAAVAKARGK